LRGRQLKFLCIESYPETVDGLPHKLHTNNETAV